MIDVLKPDLVPEARERALQMINKKSSNYGEYDPREIIDEAKLHESPLFKGLRAALMEISPDITYKISEVDPYTGSSTASWEVAPKEQPKYIGDASEKQKKMIKMLSVSEYSKEFYDGLNRKQAGAIIDKLLNNPPKQWIVDKLRNMHIGTIPKTNKEGMDLLRRGRQQ